MMMMMMVMVMVMMMKDSLPYGSVLAACRIACTHLPAPQTRRTQEQEEVSAHLPRWLVAAAVAGGPGGRLGPAMALRMAGWGCWGCRRAQNPHKHMNSMS